MKQLIIEGIVVGCIMVILHLLMKQYIKNEIHLLFLIGLFGHFIFEAVGANKWYCKNGYSCKK